MPLDIEIFLRVNGTSADPPARARSVSPSGWAYPHGPGGSTPPTYIIAQPSSIGIPILPPSHTPIIIPPSPHHDPWNSPPHPSSTPLPQPTKASMHWGHIAIYYLVAQMHRWDRFVFRFDKQFSSMAALKCITGRSRFLPPAVNVEFTTLY